VLFGTVLDASLVFVWFSSLKRRFVPIMRMTSRMSEIFPRTLEEDGGSVSDGNDERCKLEHNRISYALTRTEDRDMSE
jgi:hypothetical protein